MEIIPREYWLTTEAMKTKIILTLCSGFVRIHKCSSMFSNIVFNFLYEPWRTL